MTAKEKKAYDRAYYKAHKKEIIRRQQAYNKLHVKEKKAYDRVYQQAWYAANKEERKTNKTYRASQKKSRKKYDLKSLYGIGPKDVARMRKEQGGRCKICGRRRKLEIDHCHKTKVVRGLLCHYCNAMLGLALDNPETLAKARKYLLVSKRKKEHAVRRSL